MISTTQDQMLVATSDKTEVTLDQLNSFIESQDNWVLKHGILFLTYKFVGFDDATIFIKNLFGISSKLNHHGTITNLYNEVSITLATHELGNTITNCDIMWATMANETIKLLQEDYPYTGIYTQSVTTG